MTSLEPQQTRTYPEKPQQVYLFGTCIADIMYPESGMDAITLLEREGIEVIYPQGQTCCGQPAYNSGYEKEAKKVALHQIAQFPLDIPIVVISGSCGGMMRHHYMDLLKDQHDSDIEQFSERIFEFTEFLHCVLKMQLTDKGSKTKVALHTSCAARREMGVHTTGKALLEQLDKVQVVEPDRVKECCGFGGTFSVKHPDISAAMVEDKSNNLIATTAPQYISADWGCMMNINGALEFKKSDLRGKHIASFLLERVKG